MKTDRIIVRVEPTLKSRLQQIADEENMKVSEVVRIACEDFCWPLDWVNVPIVGTISERGIELIASTPSQAVYPPPGDR